MKDLATQAADGSSSTADQGAMQGEFDQLSNELGNITANTFAIDPDFRTGYAQNWQASVQRDLPYAMQMVATYLGIKGTRSQQQFLPNTFPAGALNPCPTCPSGFAYLTSNGNSIRHAGMMQLRRRLRSGFTAEL